MRQDPKLTKRIQNWLESPKDSRNLDEGAMILLKLTANQLMYRKIMRDPQKYANYIEQQLQRRLKARVIAITHEQVVEMEDKVARIESVHLTLPENDPENEFRKGKRLDHDSLPEEIKQLYVDNLYIVQRMRGVHAELRVVTRMEPGMVCLDSDKYPFLKELIELDTQLHDNWKRYDEYDPEKGEVVETEDMRQESKKALAFINFNKKKYALDPSEELRDKLYESYKKVLHPTEKLRQELIDMDIIPHNPYM